jgi:CubicO group peptidase (beta-lactamase class C family)
MQRSTFSQPPPPVLAVDMTVGYSYVDGVFMAGDYVFSQSVPAAALSTTAADMANFMIAHLQKGRFGENRILEKNTIEDMHRLHYSHDPRTCSWTYGFIERQVNNQRLIGHDGIYIEFHSMLYLFPEHQLGLFVSYNGAGGFYAK